MDCWHCKRTAVGSCRFCGRGICEDHVQVHPYILELFKTKDVTRVVASPHRRSRPTGPPARPLARSPAV